MAKKTKRERRLQRQKRRKERKEKVHESKVRFADALRGLNNVLDNAFYTVEQPFLGRVLADVIDDFIYDEDGALLMQQAAACKAADAMTDYEEVAPDLVLHLAEVIADVYEED